VCVRESVRVCERKKTAPIFFTIPQGRTEVGEPHILQPAEGTVRKCTDRGRNREKKDTEREGERKNIEREKKDKERERERVERKDRERKKDKYI